MLNRKIKFRVWNNKAQTWVHGPGDECNIFGEMILLGGFMKGINVEELNNCVALQFTGILDKNGKEIYEGDILLYKTSYEEAMTYEGENDISLVIFKNGCFMLDKNCLHELVENGKIQEEIIGNIFQNPELINDK